MSHYFPVDSSLIERNGTIPKETVDRLQSLGLFGQQIPTEYGKDFRNSFYLLPELYV